VATLLAASTVSSATFRARASATASLGAPAIADSPRRRAPPSRTGAATPQRASRTAASIARTVSPRARSTQAASSSPRATGSTTCAFRAETSPLRTASRSSGLSRSARASFARFRALVGEHPSRSRA
jgi:hypothetical protein